MAVSTGKVWVGPLLLILLIALIYIFSLLPHNHHKNSYIYGDDEVEMNSLNIEKPHPGYEFTQTAAFKEFYGRMKSHLCNYRGYAVIRNDNFIGCECANFLGNYLFSGPKCENLICLHNGTNVEDTCQCEGPWMGKHCEQRCQGDTTRNGTNVSCDCKDRFYGEYCEIHCNEKTSIWDSRTKTCTCFNGYEPPACLICIRPDCTISQNQHKKGVVNSRLTLSGLSFCLITIGLLCITARRRRLAATALPGTDETWYRIFQPQAAGRRCRHDFVCGGSWIPRDRALLVGQSSNRQPTQARLARNNRSLTPPPSYCSVEQLNDGSGGGGGSGGNGGNGGGAPPTYEEAVHRNETHELDHRIIEDSNEDQEDKEPQNNIDTQHDQQQHSVTQINEETPNERRDSSNQLNRNSENNNQ